MRTIVLFPVILVVAVLLPTAALSDEPVPWCVGEYAEDLSRLTPASRELEKQAYSYCVRNTATYECLSYGDDGSVRRTRKKAIAHGTAFAYQKQPTGETLLLTNEHVADWPTVTDEQHPVDGVPAGCKRVNESLKIVDNEDDDFDRDDIPLTKVVSDTELDAAILKTKAQLSLMPWKIGRSAALHERDIVEVRGFPLGAFRATNVGKVISPHDHDDQGEWNHDDFVIDALLSAGNSGSPVLAVSCKTGEFELVGIYHAGYVQGSALNVVVGIDQLRTMMSTLKKPAKQKGDPVAQLDATARVTLTGQITKPGVEPFFPLGNLVARVAPRVDGALVFEVFSRDFPFNAAPIFAFEDLPSPTGGFGEPGRLWFGSTRGLKRLQRGDLDADSLAQAARLVEALRHDATAFFAFRADRLAAAGTRAEFEKQARQARTLKKTQQLRRELATMAADLADHWAPRDNEPITPVADLFVTPVPPALATTAKSAPTR